MLQNKQTKKGEAKFDINGKELERAKELQYSGRMLRQDDDDTPTIIRQIKKTCQSWNGISRILKHKGANAVTIEQFYMAVVQSVSLYGKDSWTINNTN